MPNAEQTTLTIQNDWKWFAYLSSLLCASSTALSVKHIKLLACQMLTCTSYRLALLSRKAAVD